MGGRAARPARHDAAGVGGLPCAPREGGASGLAADATKALAKCEKANASGKGAPVDCSQDPGLAKARDKARREIARCRSFAGLDGCGAAGDADGALACLEAALEEPAVGYVGATWP